MTTRQRRWLISLTSWILALVALYVAKKLGGVFGLGGMDVGLVAGILTLIMIAAAGLMSVDWWLERRERRGAQPS